MSEEKKKAVSDELDIRFVGLVNLIAQMSAQLLEEKRVLEARGLIDGLTALEAKTQGNLSPDEAKLLESLLYQLRMAAISADKKAEADAKNERESAESSPPAEESAES